MWGEVETRIIYGYPVENVDATLCEKYTIGYEYIQKENNLGMLVVGILVTLHIDGTLSEFNDTDDLDFDSLTEFLKIHKDFFRPDFDGLGYYCTLFGHDYIKTGYVESDSFDPHNKRYI